MKILAVTACPTGIAHTFMAAQSIENMAKEMGHEIKVETNGAAGAENILTVQEIKEADLIIVAADKQVEMDRFEGKKVLMTSVASAIHKPQELIQRGLIENIAPYSAQSNMKTSNETAGRQVYKHLMNGISNMLPFVVAGGILIAISLLFGIYSADQTSDQYNVFAKTLNEIGGTSLGLMVPVLSAFIAYSIANKPGLVAGFVGGMIANNTGSGFLGAIIVGFASGYLVAYLIKLTSKIPKEFEGIRSILIIPLVSVFIIGTIMFLTAPIMSGINTSMIDFLTGLQGASPILLGLVIGIMVASDFGGPINKAAYITGTILLAEGNFYFMAGVSAACITPPLVCAFATTFFKKEFTKDERAAGLVNYLLGSTHITEGAIPFVAKDPFRLIPIMMIGSSISAILTYIFAIQDPAPHGGFLILPLISAPFLWFTCIMIGSLIAAVLMGLNQRRLNKKEGVYETTTN